MDWKNILVLTAFIFTFVLSTILSNNASKSKSHSYFRYVGYAVSAWCLSMFFYRLVGSEFSNLWGKLLYFSASFTPSLFLLFAISFPDTRVRNRWLYPILGLNMLIAFLCLFDKAVIDQVIINEQGEKIIQFGRFYYLLFIWYTPLLFSLGFVVFSFKLMNAKTNVQKMQLRYIIIGSGISATIAMITNLLLPTFNYFELNWVGQVSTILWVSFVSYAILRHRLFDIRFLYSRVLVLFASSIIPYATFFALAYFYEQYWGTSLNSVAFILGIPVVFVFVVITRFIYEKVDDYINKTVLYSGSSPEARFIDFAKNVNNLPDTEAIIDEIVVHFRALFGIDTVNYIDYQDGSINFDMTKGIPVKYLDSMQKIIEYWELNGFQTLILSELSQISLSKEMINILRELRKSLDVSVIYPLSLQDELIGAVLIGSRNDNGVVDDNVLTIFSNFISTLTLSVQRARLYDKLEDANDNLQQKIEKATKELRQKVKQLQDARQKEQDMIDIMGHELRTPASVIKINADLLKTMKERLKIPAKEQGIYNKINKSITRIIDSTENQIKLINALLTSAKIEGNRLSLTREAVDLNKIFDLGLAGQEKNAENKGLEIIYRKPDQELPYVYADPTRLQQVVDNLLSNAVKYTREGKVEIKVEKVNKDYIQVSISDTGIGIPENEIKRLGEKFYRVGQYLDEKEKSQVTTRKVEKTMQDGRNEVASELDLSIVRPGGTGLGLYVTFELVKAHGGKIWVESEVGEGTTFHFTIPIYDEEKYGKIVRRNTKNVFDKMGLTDGAKPTNNER